MRATKRKQAVERSVEAQSYARHWLAALLVLPFLTGCVAPVFLPVLMASGAAGGMGANMIGDALTGSIETNPELRMQPDFAHDAQLQEELAEVQALHDGFTPGYLEATRTSGNCILGDHAQWLISHRMPEAQVKRVANVQFAEMGPSASIRTDTPQVVVIEGNCADGVPVGAFVAVATMVTRTSIMPDMVTTGVQRQRISGTFMNGAPDGVWRIVSQDSYVTGQHLHEKVIAGIERFADGAPVGRHLSQVRSDQSTTTTITEHRGDGAYSARHYAGRLPHSTMQFKEGLQHGWLEVHAIEYVVGHRTEASRTCYQHGREATASLCGPTDV